MASLDTTSILLEIDQLKDHRETLETIIQEKEATLYRHLCHNAHKKLNADHSFPGWQDVQKCNITAMSTLKMSTQYDSVPEQCISRLPLSHLVFLVSRLRTVIDPSDQRVFYISPFYHNGTGIVEKSRKHLLRDHVLFLCDNGCDNCGIVSHTTHRCVFNDNNHPVPYVPQVVTVRKETRNKNKNRNKHRNRNRKSKNTQPLPTLQ